MAFRLVAASLCLRSAASSEARAPVILVPGLTGSALEARLDHAAMPHFECRKDTKGGWKSVWMSVGSMLPREIDCELAILTLTYDAANDTYSNLPGVELRAKGFGSGDKRDLLYRYEFGPMVKHLEGSLGYQLGRDLLLAPYDWRLAADAHARRANGVGGFYAQLQALLEESVRLTGRRAVVVSHSLGCPTVLAFFHTYVSKAWRAQFIDSWFALSGPWVGSATQMKAYMGGTTLGLPTWLVPHDYVKPVQVNASSGVWLSPDPLAFGSRPIVLTPSRNYTAHDLPSLISAIGPQAGGEQALALHRKLSADLPSWQRAPENVPMKVWYSNGVKTEETFEYSRDVCAGFNAAPSKVHYGDGDGTVNLASLQYAEKHWPRVSSAPMSSQSFPNVSHFGMLSDRSVLEGLAAYLNELASLEAVIVV